MIARFRERPIGLLTRHFFRALFDLGVFTQEGADALVRVVIGLSAFLISLGLLLVYMYAKKYAALSVAATGEPYATALLADTTLAIALPMWIVALVTVVVSQSLFPDETDFRVLMPLPIDRRVVFAAKLLALVLFAGLFTLASHVALTPLVLRISLGRWAVDRLAPSLLTFWIVGPVASAFAVLTIVAMNGLVVVSVPRARVRAVSATLRSAMIGALMLALPLVMAAPTLSEPIARQSRLLLLAPPVWFMGLARVLLGHRDAFVVRLAQLAGIGFVAVAAIAGASYSILYRRFDRVMLRSLSVSRRRPWRRRLSTSPARAAVDEFTTATFGRSTLHQGVIVGVSAAGLALAMNSLVRNGVLTWLRGYGVPLRYVVETIAWVPFPLIVILGLAARAALAVPIEPKANWVFRMSECDATRVDELHAAERIITRFAALFPVVLTLPLQWLLSGPHAIAAAAITGVFGLAWAEVLLRDWRRIPFTCSYMPGKRTVAQSFVTALFLFLFVGTIGAVLEVTILRGRALVAPLVVAGVLGLFTIAQRYVRRREWRELPLMFDDELPTDVQVFRLTD